MNDVAIAQSSGNFAYSKEQWDRIVIAAGAHSIELDRAEITQDAIDVLWLHRRAGSTEAINRRLADAKKLLAAEFVLANLPIDPSEYAETIKILRERYEVELSHYALGKAQGKRRSTMFRDMLVHCAIGRWGDFGEHLGLSKNGKGKEPYGPLVRWVQACVEPAFGPVNGNAVEAVLRKERPLREEAIAKNGFR